MKKAKTKKAKYPTFSPIFRCIYNHQKTKMALACSFLIVLVYLVASSTSNGLGGAGGTMPKRTTLSSEELENLLSDISGNDQRLMRWSAKSHTRNRQHDGGCDSLPHALNVILSASESKQAYTKQMVVDVTKAMEYATFCITDNPEQRAIFSTHDDGLHEAIVSFLVLASPSGRPVSDVDDEIIRSASAMAGHVIYIASFDNARNQQGFFKAGAVKNLGEVVLDESSSPLQLMWALAALQNIMASYCNTDGNGRCSWKFKKGWKSDASNPPQLIVSPKMTVVADGQPIREAVRNHVKLIQRVVDLTIRGPVRGEMSDENPYVGHNAKVGRHDNSPNIVAWAAAGAIKNLILDPQARFYLLQQDSWKQLHFALCRLAYSPDWLEQNKGESALGNLLPEATCWFDDEKDPHGPLCFDDLFVDEDGYTCADYDEKVSASECRASGVLDKTKTAIDSCCYCGGGNPDDQWTKKIPREEHQEL